MKNLEKLKEDIMKLSDKVDRLERETTDLDDKTRSLRRKVLNKKKCMHCGSTKTLGVPYAGPTDVKKMEEKIRKLDDEYYKKEEQIENVLDEVTDIISKLFEGTRFDVYGVELS